LPVNLSRPPAWADWRRQEAAFAATTPNPTSTQLYAGTRALPYAATFGAQLSPEARAILGRVVVTTNPVYSAIRGNAYTNIPGFEAISLKDTTNPSVAAHEYGHAVSAKMPGLTSAAWAAATPQQIAATQASYGSSLGAKLSWASHKKDEFFAEQLYMARGNYFMLPINLRPAFAPMFNRRMAQDVGRYRTGPNRNWQPGAPYGVNQYGAPNLAPR
jgi:hypothetical protein